MPFFGFSSFGRCVDQKDSFFGLFSKIRFYVYLYSLDQKNHRVFCQNNPVHNGLKKVFWLWSSPVQKVHLSIFLPQTVHNGLNKMRKNTNCGLAWSDTRPPT